MKANETKVEDFLLSSKIKLVIQIVENCELVHKQRLKKTSLQCLLMLINQN